MKKTRMQEIRQIRQTLRHGLLALVIGGAAITALAQSAPPYQNGGIGGGEQQAMKAAAQDYNLHLLFAQGSNSEYISDVQLDITDAQGKSVLKLPSAGPMTDVKLAPGRYKLSATYKGQTKTQSVGISDGKPVKLSMNWAGN